MNSRRFATGLSALTLLAAAPLAAAMPATAADGGPGNGTSSRSAQAEPDTTTATCPAGQRAVSGGFRGPQGSTAILNRRTAADTWTVVSSDGGAPQQAYVYCSSTVAPTAVKATVTFPEDNHQPGIATATCPQGRKAVSGGWEYGNQGTSNSPVFSSRPTANGRGWEVQAFTQGADTLTAYAYCAPVTTVVRTATSTFETSESSKGVAQVSCKPSETSLSGGFSVSPDADYYNSTGPDPFFYGSLRIGSASWKAQAVNYSSYNETDSTVTAYAVCTS